LRRTFGRSPLVCLAALVVYGVACAPGPASEPADNGFTTSTSGAGGAGGEGIGGGIFSTGNGNDCTDPTDGDGDGVADQLEPGDADEDGTPNAESLDSDGDGYPDEIEAVNGLLPPGTPGQTRSSPCDPIADTDGDGTPDLMDRDSDNDGVPDDVEASYDPDGSTHCFRLVDCDGDGVIDIVELAAGSDPSDAASVPEDPGLYFVLPYESGPQTKDFTFSTGVAKADIYFLVDTTASMQPTIDALTSSLDTEVIPTILNGDPTKSPPIPAISDAWIGVGTFRDVPWGGYGQPGDDIYRHRFNVDGQTVVGAMTPPVESNGTFKAPANVQKILGSLVAGGGGDGPEATTQALWIASTNQPYAATIGGVWSPAAPYPAPCGTPGSFGVPCFRPDSLPVFVILTDAALHNGPQAANAYDGADVGQTKTYGEAVTALNDIHAKIVGVPIAGGNPGAARSDLNDLAKKTTSLYHDPAFGGTDAPLVPTQDIASGKVSDEVVRLLGLLAGAGIHDVTTDRDNYDCAGEIDCTGDGVADLEYHNPTVAPASVPYDASTFITEIEALPSASNPLPYVSLDDTTFYGVPGAAEVTFRVHAENKTLKPTSLLVMRALVRVETPAGQILGGAKGIKLVYFVIPQYIPTAS
jgi:hypothetical protein